MWRKKGGWTQKNLGGRLHLALPPDGSGRSGGWRQAFFIRVDCNSAYQDRKKERMGRFVHGNKFEFGL